MKIVSMLQSLTILGYRLYNEGGKISMKFSNTKVNRIISVVIREERSITRELKGLVYT